MTQHSVQQPAFGLRLKQLRRERKMSQRHLAGESMTSSYISLLEAGTRVPRSDVVHRLAQTLEVDVEELVGAPPPPNADDGPAEPPREEPQRIPPIEELGQALAGDPAARRSILEQAYRSAGQSGDPRDVMIMGMGLQAQCRADGDAERALCILAECEAAALRSGSAEAQVRIGTEAAITCRDLGRLEAALHHATTADRLIADSDLEGTVEQVKLLAVQLSVRTEMGLTSGLDDLVDHMITLATKVGDPPTTGRAHWAACMALSRSGQHTRAAEHVVHARAMVANPDTPLADWARFLRDAAGILVEDPSRQELARQFLAEAQSTASMLHDATGEAEVTAVTARLALGEGDPQQALALGLQAREHLTGADEIGVALTIGRAQFALGHIPEGTATLRQTADLATSMGSHAIASRIWRELADLQA